MSIITKPSIVKGTPAQFTLNKVQLLANSVVAADSYFSDSQNWYRVNLVYKSTVGGQYEIVEFDATQSSPTGNFLISEKARDSFEILKIKIIDFDGGFLEIPRSSLASADFDIAVGGSVALSFLSINSEEITTSETGGWVFYNGDYYNLNNGATRIIKRIGTGPVRSLGVTLSDGNPTTDGMEWVPISVTISGGNSSSSFTPIKTFSFVRSDFTANALKYLVLDSDQSFEFYRITFNSYDKTYGGSLFVQGQVSLHQAAPAVGNPIIWDTFLNGAIAEADGGISGGAGNNMVKSNASKVLNGADFKVTYNFTMTSGDEDRNLVHGIMNSISDTVFAGLTGITYQSTDTILIYDNYSGSGAPQTTFSNSMMNQNGSNTAIFEKIGNVLTIKMNGVTIYTNNNYTEQTMVPAIRTWALQAIDSGYVLI